MEEVKREEGGLEKNVLVQMSSVLYFAGVSLVLALSLSLSLFLSPPLHRKSSFLQPTSSDQ